MGRKEDLGAMKEFPYTELEIVGFVGAVLGPCGHSLPIARHKKTGVIFKLAAASSLAEGETAHETNAKAETRIALTQSVHRESEVDSLRRAGFLTILPNSLSPILGSVVVYITRRLLGEIG